MARPKRKYSAKQLAGLKPIKKGEVRNPEGGRAHDPFKKELKNLARKEFQEILTLALRGDFEELKAFFENPKNPVLQSGIARIVHDACIKGQWSIVKEVVESVIGKPAQEIKLSGSIAAEPARPERTVQEIEEEILKLQAIDAEVGNE